MTSSLITSASRNRTPDGTIAPWNCRIHVADCDDGDPTAVQLALMTDPGSNMVADGTLVWAISWLGTTSCGVSGGGNPWPNTPAQTPTPRCGKVAFIDARSNEFYFTIASRHE